MSYVNLDRDNVIALLGRLGSERDDEVLAAARELHQTIAAAGVGWDTLLVPPGGSDQTDPDEAADDEGDPDRDAERDLPPLAGDSTEVLALIEHLLAGGQLTAETAAELRGYQADIAAGEFTDHDARYVRDLYSRLSRKR